MKENIAKLPRLQMETRIKAIIEDRESSAQFDNTWLADLNERQLLELTGARITPLVVNPGRVLVTNSRLYLTFLFAISVSFILLYIFSTHQ